MKPNNSFFLRVLFIILMNTHGLSTALAVSSEPNHVWFDITDNTLIQLILSRPTSDFCDETTIYNGRKNDNTRVEGLSLEEVVSAAKFYRSVSIKKILTMPSLLRCGDKDCTAAVSMDGRQIEIPLGPAVSKPVLQQIREIGSLTNPIPTSFICTLSSFVNFSWTQDLLVRKNVGRCSFDLRNTCPRKR